MWIKRKAFFIIILLVAASFYMGIFVSTAQQEKEGLFENLRLFSQVLSLVKTQYVEEVDSEKLIHGAINGMLSSLGDPHTHFLEPPDYKNLQVETKGEFGGLGIEIDLEPLTQQLMVVAPIEGTPAYRAGVEAGDKIIEIEKESTRGITLQDAVKKLRGIKGTEVTITVKRDDADKPLYFTIVRDVIKLKAVKSEMMLDDNVGYLRIVTFNQNTGKELNSALTFLEGKKMKSLILDLRNNPGGLLEQAVEVSSQFISKGVIVSTKGRAHKETKYFSRSENAHPYYPLIVLVNKGSASASEIVAGAVKDTKRGLILGTTTFGKGSVQTVVNLEDGSGLAITTARYYTPSGICIQDTGINPDIEVEDKYFIDVEESKMFHILRRNNCFELFAKDVKKRDKNIDPENFKMEDKEIDLFIKVIEEKKIDVNRSALNKYKEDIEREIKISLAELEDKNEGKKVSLLTDPVIKRAFDLMKGVQLLQNNIHDREKE